MAADDPNFPILLPSRAGGGVNSPQPTHSSPPEDRHKLFEVGYAEGAYQAAGATFIGWGIDTGRPGVIAVGIMLFALSVVCIFRRS